MEAMAALIGIIVVVGIIIGVYAAPKNPRDCTTGRWGIKLGKIASGNFGGEKWGEKKN